jgi:hypothetical protein
VTAVTRARVRLPLAKTPVLPTADAANTNSRRSSIRNLALAWPLLSTCAEVCAFQTPSRSQHLSTWRHLAALVYLPNLWSAACCNHHCNSIAGPPAKYHSCHTPSYITTYTLLPIIANSLPTPQTDAFQPAPYACREPNLVRCCQAAPPPGCCSCTSCYPCYAAPSRIKLSPPPPVAPCCPCVSAST